MRRTSLALILTTLLAACSGGGTEPTPTPAVTVARIAYTTDKALLFTGKAVPVRALVRGYDASGNELPSSALAITAPAGWSVRGDSLVASATESRGALTASGKALAFSGSAYAGAADVTSTEVTAAVDLRAFNWTASYRCVADPLDRSNINEGGIPVDSIGFAEVTVDSVTYPGDLGYYRNTGGIAQLWWHGDVTRWVRDGTTEVAPASGFTGIMEQRPDTIVFEPPTGGGPAPAVKVAPNTYVGGSWCSSSWSKRRGDVTFVGVPK